METEFKSISTEPKEIPGRFTAYKVWLSDIKEKQFKPKDGEIPDHVDIRGNQVARVNIVASVVDKFNSEKFASVTLDDGSSQIRLKAFSDSMHLISGLESGDIVMTIARLRTFNDEVYLLPEIVKKVSSKHALLRRLELIIEFGKREHDSSETNNPQSNDGEKPNSLRNDIKEKIKIYLETLDEGEGVETSLIESKFSGDDLVKVQQIIEEFLGEGEIYEPRPGRVKLI